MSERLGWCEWRWGMSSSLYWWHVDVHKEKAGSTYTTGLGHSIWGCDSVCLSFLLGSWGWKGWVGMSDVEAWAVVSIGGTLVYTKRRQGVRTPRASDTESGDVLQNCDGVARTEHSKVRICFPCSSTHLLKIDWSHKISDGCVHVLILRTGTIDVYCYCVIFANMIYSSWTLALNDDTEWNGRLRFCHHS